jgi:hypothetical protein
MLTPSTEITVTKSPPTQANERDHLDTLHHKLGARAESSRVKRRSDNGAIVRWEEWVSGREAKATLPSALLWQCCAWFA